MHNKSNFFYRKMQENLLFDTDEFIKRPDSNQQEFEDLLIPYKGDIETASNEALGKLNEFMAANPKHHYLDSALPILYNGFFIGCLKDHIGADKFGLSEANRQFMRLGNYIVYIKKLNDRYEPMNIPTGNTQRISAQYASNTEDPSPVVFLGYRFKNGGWSELEGLYVSYIDKESSEKWITDISTLSYGQASLSDNVITMPNNNHETRRLTIRPNQIQKSE